jgi:hypothetical protein
VETERVVDELLGLPMARIEEARIAAPEKPGSYAWWCDRSAIPPKLPAPPHPTEPYNLLYVGIAPSGPRSASNLRRRLRQHTSANIGSSTFRFSLTALLWQQEGWRPRWNDRPILDDRDLSSLGSWQLQHLAVRWREDGEPWSTESKVISLMRPPMNRDHNDRHPFFTSMGVARNELRRAGRAS